MQVSHVDERVTHAVIGGRKAIDFGISDSPEFFHILSSTLYTDQRLAVIREVVCNGWDAHIASGRTNLPVEVTVEANQIIIRDFGNGIADENMGPIYCVYGNSTKQNDGKQTGGFGLGCKAPFAYTDHFQVVSCHKGTKTIYALSKSSAVVGGKPGITPIVSMPTEEHGISVSIPIKGSADANYFIQKLRDLVYFGDIFLTLNGKTLPTIDFKTNYILSTRINYAHIYIRYGNVIYPFSECSELSREHEKVQKILYSIKGVNKNYGLILQAPPDSISVTPSRESLSMQEKTVATVKTLMTNFINEFNYKAQSEAQLQVVRDGFKNPNIDSLATQAFSRYINATFFKIEAKDTLSSVYDVTQSTMQVVYPQVADVRFLEVKERINLLIRLNRISKHFGITFLKAYKENLKKGFHNIFARNHYGNVEGNNAWFFKVYAKNIIRKIQTSNLDLDRLYISDSRQIGHKIPSVENLYHIKSANFISINDCFPYLRNIVVLNTSRAAMKGGSNISDGKNQVAAGDGFLFYHVGMKKNDEQEALDFWKSTGMTVINMCGTNQTFRNVSAKPKKEKKAGYPLLSNVWHKEKINTKRLLREEGVDYTETPEFYVVASTNKDKFNHIPGFYNDLYFKHFGSKGVVVLKKSSEDLLKKKGIPDFGNYAAAKIAAYISGNASIFKNASMSRDNVYKALRGMSSEKAESVRDIFATPDLVEYFNLGSELSELDDEYMSMLNSVSEYFALSEDNAKLLSGLKVSLKTATPAQEITDFIEKVKDNPVLEFINVATFKNRFAETTDPQEKSLLLDLFKTMFSL